MDNWERINELEREYSRVEVEFARVIVAIDSFSGPVYIGEIAPYCMKKLEMKIKMREIEEEIVRLTEMMPEYRR
jgi:hypothetical protein